MKKRLKMLAAMVVVALMGLGTAAVMAVDYYVPDGASVKTARFYVMDDMENTGDEFSMISEDEELVIHIHYDTLIYFEYELQLSDNPEDGMSRMARDLLHGQTLAELLHGRKLVVTYAVTTRSIPPQTSPISVVILFETAVHLPGQVDGEYQTPVTLPAEIDPMPLIYTSPFEDLYIDAWYFNPVVWAFENGIMNGISETEFAPEAPMTRAMLVTVLWRYAGEPDAGLPAFADVAYDTWYGAAVAWAAENGIVTGVSETEFSPNEFINREQMYTILYRYMNSMGLTMTLEEEMRLQQFADDDLVSDWAREALHFMFDAGVMFRYSTMDNYARPHTYALRGEIAGAMFFFDMFAH